MKKIRVLHINDDCNVGGANTYISILKKGLQKDVESLTLCFGRNNVNGVISIPTSRYRIIRNLHGVFFYYKAYKIIKKTINSFKPDLIHIHNADRYVLTIMQACKSKKIVKTIHDFGMFCPRITTCKRKGFCRQGISFECVENKCIIFFEYFIYRYLFVLKHYLYRKYVSLFICPSRIIKDYAVKFGFKNSVYVPMGINPAEWKCRTKKKNYDLIFVGALEKNKGIILLAEAVLLLEKEFPKIKLLVCGDGSLGNELKKFITKNNLSNNIILKGFVDKKKLLNHYCESNITVVPSIGVEQFSLVGLESLTCGVPCIGANIGGIPEWLEDGKVGFLFEPSDKEDLIEKIKLLLNDENKTRKFGLAGMRIVQEKNNIHKIKDIIYSYYKQFV